MRRRPPPNPALQQSSRFTFEGGERLPPPLASSAKGFTPQQLECYWATNTLLQHYFRSRPKDECARAAAGMVSNGLTDYELLDVIHSLKCLDYKDIDVFQDMDRKGFSIEQLFKWLKAPSESPLAKQQATRDDLRIGWAHGLDRAKEIDKIASREQLKQGVGALVVVGCSVAAVVFHGIGYGNPDPAFSGTGTVMLDYASEAFQYLRSLDLKTLGGKVAAASVGYFTFVGARAWSAERNKAMIDGRRLDLTSALSKRQLEDPILLQGILEIPEPHSCLISHLGRSDLEIFIKGDDVLRSTILRNDPPDHGQRRQFAFMEAKNTWEKLTFQLDVSLLRWGNKYGKTSSAKTLAGMRKARLEDKKKEISVAPSGDGFGLSGGLKAHPR